MAMRISSKNCSDCGKALQRVNGHYKKRCSLCDFNAKELQKKKYLETRKMSRPPIILDLVCDECGEPFQQRLLGAKPRFCEDCKSGTVDLSGKKRPAQFVLNRGRRHHFKKMYGLTLDARAQILKRQKSKCAICGVIESESMFLQVDHDHDCCPGSKTCGECIRGLICPKCNRALGLMNDSEDLITRLIKYLEKYRSKVVS